MKAEIKLNEQQIAQAVKNYMQTLGLQLTVSKVHFTATENRNAMDQLIGGAIISATVEVDIGDAEAQ